MKSKMEGEKRKHYFPILQRKKSESKRKGERDNNGREKVDRRKMVFGREKPKEDFFNLKFKRLNLSN